MMSLASIDFPAVRNAFDFLIVNRIARTLSGDGPRLRANESEIAQWLDRVSLDDSYELLDKLLENYGFTLERKDSSTTDGVPSGSVWFFIVRSDYIGTPPWMGVQQLYEQIRCKYETLHAARRWTFFLWYLLQGLLYTRLNRLPESALDHTKAWFTEEEFIDLATNKVEEIRQAPLSDRNKDVETILVNSEWKHISARVKRLLKFLVKINHIVQIPGRNEYCQTLVGAKEIAQHARIGFSHIINDDLAKNGFTLGQLDHIYTDTDTLLEEE